MFYHNIDELEPNNKNNPSGVIILENYNVNTNGIQDTLFAFNIIFSNEPQKCHILSGNSASQIERWIYAIKQASYGYWRSQLIILQQVISKKTGKDPLLMYPINRGVIRDEAWESKSSFKSHLKSFAQKSPPSTVENLRKEMNLIDLT